MPRQAVSYKVRLVCIRDVWCLVVDGIVSPDDRIMNHSHVTGTGCKQVILGEDMNLEASFNREVSDKLSWSKTRGFVSTGEGHQPTASAEGHRSPL
jgi:hypothetical protein